MTAVIVLVTAIFTLQRDDMYRATAVAEVQAPVADVRVPEASGRVEVAVAVGVVDPDALAAVEHDLAAGDLPHVGERVPEVRHIVTR